MPRLARLDAPTTLHHVMVRGLDRHVIFRDAADRADFVRRLAALAEAGALTVLAWALLPNHAHLLVRTGARPLARSMRSLLTGYAGGFNRRHQRVGHLFQNRYKSVVVEEEAYLVELVRYLHLNPLRARLVKNYGALDRFPWSGHSALLGTVPRPWQATHEVLARFGATPARGKRAYRSFVAAGVPQGRRPDLQGGGLIRSYGGWAAVQALRRGREAYLGDERILGRTAFVEQAQRRLNATRPAPGAQPSLQELLTRICRHVGVGPAALAGGGRSPRLVRAREGLAYCWIEGLGRPGRPLATVLSVRPQSVYRAAQRGRAAQAEWHRLLNFSGERSGRGIRKNVEGSG